MPRFGPEMCSHNLMEQVQPEGGTRDGSYRSAEVKLKEHNYHPLGEAACFTVKHPGLL